MAHRASLVGLGRRRVRGGGFTLRGIHSQPAAPTRIVVHAGA